MTFRLQKNKFSLARIAFFLTFLLSIPFGVGAEQFKLPPFISITTYDVGSSAYSSTAMATEAITEKTGQKFRLLPASTPGRRRCAPPAGCPWADRTSLPLPPGADTPGEPAHAGTRAGSDTPVWTPPDEVPKPGAEGRQRFGDLLRRGAGC